MKNLSTLLCLAFALLVFQNCTEHSSLVDMVDHDQAVFGRSQCGVISQSYVDQIRSLSSLALQASPGEIKVGVVQRITPNEGDWLAPSVIVGEQVVDIENWLFVAYLEHPANDVSVFGYYHDVDLCCTPSSQHGISGSFENVLDSSIGIIGVDGDGF